MLKQLLMPSLKRLYAARCRYDGTVSCHWCGEICRTARFGLLTCRVLSDVYRFFGLPVHSAAFPVPPFVHRVIVIVVVVVVVLVVVSVAVIVVVNCHCRRCCSHLCSWLWWLVSLISWVCCCPMVLTRSAYMIVALVTLCCIWQLVVAMMLASTHCSVTGRTSRQMPATTTSTGSAMWTDRTLKVCTNSFLLLKNFVQLTELHAFSLVLFTQ